MDEQEIIPGLVFKRNKQGQRVIRLHYTADPAKRPGTEFYNKMVKRYVNGVTSLGWRREMEIDFHAGSGELVFPYLLEREAKLKYDPYTVSDEFLNQCNFYGGLDWGIKNAVSFVVVAETPASKFFAVWEWYGKSHLVEEVASAIRSCPHYDKLQWIAADPTMWTPNQARQSGYTSYARIFTEDLPEDKRLNLSPAHGRLDKPAISKVHQMFDGDIPIFKISRDLTNLWRELSNLKYVEQVANKNFREEILDKDNHSWDALKYIILSHPTASVLEVKDSYGTYGYLNKIAQAAREIATETGESYQSIFEDLYGRPD